MLGFVSKILTGDLPSVYANFYILTVQRGKWSDSANINLCFVVLNGKRVRIPLCIHMIALYLCRSINMCIFFEK